MLGPAVPLGAPPGSPLDHLLAGSVPARYYLVALREIILKGAGPSVWWSQVVGLAVFAAAVLALATVRTVRSL